MTYTIDLDPFPKDLTRLRILITNDDGIHAQGLRVLLELAQSISQDVWVVAPEAEQSGAGHSISINRPVRPRKLGDKRYVVEGTPTDCVLMAIQELMKGQKPHLILSGVNHGPNIAEDVTYSGTVSAAMEGTLLGVPSIALSAQVQSDNSVVWETVLQHGPEILQKLLRLTWSKGVLINVNFPGCNPAEVKGIQAAAQGFHDLRKTNLEPIKDPYGRQFYWLGSVRNQDHYPLGTDLYYLHDNYITLTPLHMDLTHAAMLKKLRDSFPL